MPYYLACPAKISDFKIPSRYKTTFEDAVNYLNNIILLHTNIKVVDYRKWFVGSDLNDAQILFTWKDPFTFYTRFFGQMTEELIDAETEFLFFVTTFLLDREYSFYYLWYI